MFWENYIFWLVVIFVEKLFYKSYNEYLQSIVTDNSVLHW